MPLIGSFLQRSRHGTKYYFRRRVPDDLRELLRRNQLYRSLGTDDRLAALIEARKLAVQTDALFARLREMTGSKDDDGQATRLRPDDWGAFGLAPEPPVRRRNAHVRTPEQSIRPRTNPQDDRAHVEPRVTIEYTARFRQDGSLESVEVEPDNEADHQRAMEMVAQRLPAPVAKSTGDRPIGMSLGEAVELWLKFVAGNKAPNTHKEYSRYANKRLLPFFGADASVQSLKQAKFAAFAEVLLADATLAAATKNHVLSVVSGFSAWLVGRGLIATPLTTKSLSVAASTAASRERGGFELNDLRAIFEQVSSFRAAEPAKFWVTVASALLGTRVEELAQVDLANDVVRDAETGTWGISINSRPDTDGVVRKALKRPSSERIVPVHPALVRLGFIDFLHRQRDRGLVRPFEDEWKPLLAASTKAGAPTEGVPKWSHAISKWGGNQLKRLERTGALDKGNRTYFHSLRHTVATRLALASVPENFITAYLGHASGTRTETSARYGALNDKYVEVGELVFEALSPVASLLEVLPIAPVKRVLPRPRRPVGRPRKQP